MVNKQDYLNAVNQNIEMVRGDTLAFDFSLSGLGNIAAYNALDISFTAQEHYGDGIVFNSTKGNGISLLSYNETKDEALYSVYISPNKTATLDIGRYYYDLKIQDTGNTITLMRGILTLLYDVNN